MGVMHRSESLELPYKLERKGLPSLELDISRAEMLKAELLFGDRCNICGKLETSNTRPDKKNSANKLSIDHDHKTNQFRGFLCVQCNRNLGWYEAYKEKIEAYNHPFKDKVKK